MWFLTYEHDLVNLAKCGSVKIAQVDDDPNIVYVIAYNEAIAVNGDLSIEKYWLTDRIKREEAEALIERLAAKLDAMTPEPRKWGENMFG